MATSAPRTAQTRREMAWQERLHRHASSGLGVAAFCQYESVSTASFYRWRALLSAQTHSAADDGGSAGFIDAGAIGAKDTGLAGAGLVSENETGIVEVSLDLGHGVVLRIVRR